VELVLVDDHQIRKLHRDYLNIDTPTDVLTFPLNEAGESLAGIVVVSVETAARQAVQYRMTAIEEVLLYSIHGVLHLCGYDDVAPKDARRMRRRQEALLRECFRPASKRRSPRAS
jgi:probable rRNA maturation factor